MRAPALLRTNRDFRLLWIGESVSELGSTVTLVALPFVALIVLHATAFEVAALTAAETIFWPFIALPIGVWVDRISRRRVLLVADGGRALALLSIPIAAAMHDLTLVQLYVGRRGGRRPDDLLLRCVSVVLAERGRQPTNSSKATRCSPAPSR